MRKIGQIVILLFLFYFCCFTQESRAEIISFEATAGYEFFISQDTGPDHSRHAPIMDPMLPFETDYIPPFGTAFRLEVDEGRENLKGILKVMADKQEYNYFCGIDLLISEEGLYYSQCILQSDFGSNYHTIIILGKDYFDFMFLLTNNRGIVEMGRFTNRPWADLTWKKDVFANIVPGKYFGQGILRDSSGWKTFYGTFHITSGGEIKAYDIVYDRDSFYFEANIANWPVLISADSRFFVIQEENLIFQVVKIGN